jgi:hypothetical protein
MPALAQAPSQGSGLVVGAQFTSTQLSNGYPNDPAFGGRMTYFFSPLLGLEAQVDFFPRFERNVMAGGRKIQALFGPRIGSRWHSIGLFAKIRPGFVRYEEGQWKPGILCVAIYPPPAGCVDPQTRLAFDAGGIIEVYPWSRGIVRVDLGTLFVRSNAKSIQHPSTTTRDLQVSAGVTWRIF